MTLGLPSTQKKKDTTSIVQRGKCSALLFLLLMSRYSKLKCHNTWRSRPQCCVQNGRLYQEMSFPWKVCRFFMGVSPPKGIHLHANSKIDLVGEVWLISLAIYTGQINLFKSNLAKSSNMAAVSDRNLLNSMLSLLRWGFFLNQRSVHEVSPFLPRWSTSSLSMDMRSVGFMGASYW